MKAKKKDRPSPHPEALRVGDIKNFETLQRACADGNLALLSARRKADGAKVALVCAMSRDGDQHIIGPLAVMVEGNPYELFEPPGE